MEYHESVIYTPIFHYSPSTCGTSLLETPWCRKPAVPTCPVPSTPPILRRQSSHILEADTSSCRRSTCHARGLSCSSSSVHAGWWRQRRIATPPQSRLISHGIGAHHAASFSFREDRPATRTTSPLSSVPACGGGGALQLCHDRYRSHTGLTI
jgi:hypothetical protein